MRVSTAFLAVSTSFLACSSFFSSFVRLASSSSSNLRSSLRWASRMSMLVRRSISSAYNSLNLLRGISLTALANPGTSSFSSIPM